MLQKIRKQIEEYQMVVPGESVVLGVSGGVDSVCLLLIMMEVAKWYQLSLVVVHVNHGIREQDAKRDAEFVKKLCEEQKIPFDLYEGTVPVYAEEWGMSEEEAGRKYRYQCFRETMKRVGSRKLATAHHLGDQAETVLFHLIRGTNLNGMCGMLPVAYLEKEGITVIRPLLTFEKNELMEWVTGQNMTWCEDVTNQENHYSRNRIRNLVLPELEQINEQAVRHIASFSQCAGKYQAFFERIIDDYMNHFVIKEMVNEDLGMICSTNRERLKEQDEMVIQAVLYEMIAAVSGTKKDLNREHVLALRRLLELQSGKEVSLPYDMQGVISYDKLIIRKRLKQEEEWEYCLENGKSERVLLPDGTALEVEWLAVSDLSDDEWKKIQSDAVNSKNNYTKYFDCDTINSTLRVRKPKSEDYFVMNANGNRKKISRYFIDRKIPKEQRRNMWVVAARQEVIWLAGKRRCINHILCDETKNILVLKYEGENHEKTD